MATVAAYAQSSRKFNSFEDNWVSIAGAGSTSANRLALSAGDTLAINYQSAAFASSTITISGFSASAFTSSADLSLSSVGQTVTKVTNTGISMDVQLTLSFAFSYNDPDYGSGSTTASCVLYLRIGSPADSEPDAFGFFDASGVAPGSYGYSQAVTITGINVPVAVSATNGAQFSINGGGYTTSGSISNGQTLQVRLVSPANDSALTSVTVGSYTTPFRVFSADATPDSFVLGDQSGLPPFLTCYSQVVFVSGLAVTVNASVVGGGAVMFKNALSTPLTSTTVTNGDRLHLKMTTPATAGAAVSCTLTVGSLSRTWTLTNSSASPANGIKIPLGGLPVIGSNIIALFGGRYDNWPKARNIAAYLRGSFYVPDIAENAGLPSTLPIRGQQFANTVQSFYKLGELAEAVLVVDSRWNPDTWVEFPPVDLSNYIGYGNARNNCDFKHIITRISGPSNTYVYTGGADPTVFSPANKTAIVRVFVGRNQANMTAEYDVAMYAKFKYGAEPELVFTQRYKVEIFNSQL